MDEPIKYNFKTQVDMPFDEAVARVTEALKAEGFGVLTEIDVRATLKKKLDVDFQNYMILGACNPPLAYRALQADLEIGLLLPCNVIVYEQDGGVVVSIVNPQARLGVVQDPALEKVAADAQVRLERVIEALKK
ncbi:MAG: DUF302 domain-containing protein [Anaerolineales bacterium]|nr:DUF302 domain-containing protein [Anaerolineales bacterium]